MQFDDSDEVGSARLHSDVEWGQVHPRAMVSSLSVCIARSVSCEQSPATLSTDSQPMSDSGLALIL